MDFSIAFWILLGIFCLLFGTLVIIASIQSFRVPEMRDGIFKFKDMAINHKGATKMTAIVHLFYVRNAKLAKIATSDEVRQTVQTVMSSPSFQTSSPWEAVSRDIADQLWNDRPVAGVSVEILLENEAGTGDIQGATFTRGSVNRILQLEK